MNKSRNPFSVVECKIQASILLKSLHSSDPTKALKAAKRFQRLPDFSKFSSLESIQKQKIKRKHALLVIAIENGFLTWNELRIQANFIVGGFLNSWFVSYAEAKSHLQAKGGFLLPYKNHFFICNSEYLKRIGFNPDDLDWKLIGYDWACPKNKAAWQRLYKNWMKIKVSKS